MTDPRIEREGMGIVLVGSLNPQIFQPAWFSGQNLLRKEEAEEAKIDIIHQSVVTFSTDWLRLEVTPERFVATTSQVSHYEPLRDLVAGTFKILRHTPLNRMGLNRDLHFPMPSDEAWNSFGNRLAPKEPWRGFLERPGLLSLTMQGLRTDNYQGYINVKVEPSRRVRPGIYVHVNDHFEARDYNASQGADQMVDTLISVWSESLTRALNISQSLMGPQ